jgi:rod shape-determining protein MreB
MLNYFFGLFSHDVAIDLGTANTLVAVRGKGIVIREPSIVARHSKTKQIFAIGHKAKQMWGKTPHNLEVVRPLRGGVIADFDAAQAMLSAWIRLVHQPSGILPHIPRPRVIIGIPSGVTEVERRAVQETALSAGARQAWLIEESMAAALGAGASVDEPFGIFIVDIGGGTMEIAVISLAGLVVSKSLRLAGDAMDEAIINYFRLKHSLLIGPATAEKIKIELGSATVGNEEQKVVKPLNHQPNRFLIVRGRGLDTGLPRSLKVTEEHVGEALKPIIHEIILAVQDVVDEIPPELMVDILERGIIMAGGGSLIRNLDKAIAHQTQMPVKVADDPLTCVVRGCLKLYEHSDILAKVRITGGLR